MNRYLSALKNPQTQCSEKQVDDMGQALQGFSIDKILNDVIFPKSIYKYAIYYHCRQIDRERNFWLFELCYD